MNNKDFDYKKDLEVQLPELKQIEGFPISNDKDIITLSNPPYFTACPNPYITDFIKEVGKPYDEATDDYHCEPFISDISEGKSEPIYNLHSYHTKVPYKAIMNYINHYTNNNDIVLDAFCGTGMTGVASSQLNRYCVLSDLSPVASFISYNYNHPYDAYLFLKETNKILSDVLEEYGWMFETLHNDNYTKGRIDSVVWSDVLISPYSNSEFVFFDTAFNVKTGKVDAEFTCPFSGAKLTKRICKNATINKYDSILKKEITVNKQVPVLINYTINKKKFHKKPDSFDFETLAKIEALDIPYWFPIDKIFSGDKTKEFFNKNIFYAYQLYTKRILAVLSAIKSKCIEPIHHIWFSTHLVNLSILNRYRPEVSFPYNPFSGTYYIASMSVEANVFTAYSNKIKIFTKALGLIKSGTIVSINSATNLQVPDNSIDYIFTDPPFGHNLMYSELNFIWESWLKIYTNNNTEAIINVNQNKKLPEYFELMLSSFKEYYRVLKPKRWMTVEFHNSKSSIWNAIREGISKAGFIIAQVTILDKVQGSYNQVTASGAVEKDLVISAYKPTQSFNEKFLKQTGENLEVEFVFQYLENLPIRPTIERTDKMLYSKMLAYYVQRGYEVKLDSKSFYLLLQNNFLEEDGYWFTAKQINTFREFKKKMKLEGFLDIKQGSMVLFVTDENSSIIWLYNFLSSPKSFSDILNAYNQVSEIQGDVVPELQSLLDDNFVFEDSKYRRPKGESERTNLSEKRERVLMRVFESILIEAKSSKKKLSLVRKEALMYGFETCYKQNRFEDIITISNRLDNNILENSAELLDFVEISRIKIEGIK